MSPRSTSTGTGAPAGPPPSAPGPRPWLGPVLCALLGVALLASLAWGNRRGYWCPVRLPLTAGTTGASADFVPEAGVLYELEIEVKGPQGPNDWAFLGPLTQVSNAPLDLRWQVLSGGEPLVGGDAREAAYVVARTTSWRGRLKDALLFETFHRDTLSRRTFGLRGGGTLTRGLGHFRARTTTPHAVRIQPGSVGADFAGVEPILNVRRSRQEWVRHQRQTRVLGLAGYAFLVTSLGLSVRAMRRPEATFRRPPAPTPGSGPLVRGEPGRPATGRPAPSA